MRLAAGERCLKRLRDGTGSRQTELEQEHEVNQILDSCVLASSIAW